MLLRAPADDDDAVGVNWSCQCCIIVRSIIVCCLNKSNINGQQS
jgi:hypothetical protein